MPLLLSSTAASDLITSHHLCATVCIGYGYQNTYISKGPYGIRGCQSAGTRINHELLYPSVQHAHGTSSWSQPQVTLPSAGWTYSEHVLNSVNVLSPLLDGGPTFWNALPVNMPVLYCILMAASVY